jgi:hypothetical protein
MADKTEKLEKMNAIRAKLDDVDHSIKALIEKVANVQLELLDTPDKELEDAMGAIHTRAAENAEQLKSAIHDYEIKINQLKQSE